MVIRYQHQRQHFLLQSQTCEATRVFIAPLIVARHLHINAAGFQSLSDASDMQMDGE
ncbi:MAG: hypothetical protein QOJ02_1325 [Acidobacteriota bacterium]|jgi:hypothetical protein|nr:hypothetical protein [Acidobacteriota bacterium]